MTVVAITGGFRGIGRRSPRRACATGCPVAIGARDAAQSGGVAAQLGVREVGTAFDIRDAEQFEAFLAEERLGALDVLINNTGAASVGMFVNEGLPQS
jgi:NADP-dependent 3-hydroxy acid dehydrogenase YdfG